MLGEDPVSILKVILACVVVLVVGWLTKKLFWFIAFAVLPELRLFERKEKVEVLAKASNNRAAIFWSVLVLLLLFPVFILLPPELSKTWPGLSRWWAFMIVGYCFVFCQIIIPGVLARKSIRERLHQYVSSRTGAPRG